MELKDRKYIKNTGKLPGFANGGSIADQYGGWLHPDWKDMNWTNYTPLAGKITPVDIAPMTQQGLQGLANSNQNVLLSSVNNSIIGTPVNILASTANTRSAGSGASIVAGVAQALPGVIGATNDIYNSFQYDTTADLLMYNGGTAEKEIGGFGYEQYNGPDYNAEMKAVNKSNTANTFKSIGSGAAAGAAIGSIIPGFGTIAGGLVGGAIGAIGGIFGGASRRRKAMERLKQAEIKANALTGMNKYAALTLKIRDDNAKQIGSSFTPYIHSFKDGKASAFGFVDGKATAKVSSGETIVSPDGSSFTVPGKPNFKDSKLAILRNEDAVLSNHGASLYFQLTGDLGGALDMDQMYRINKHKSYKNGKLPRFAEGIWGNIIPSTFGMLASLDQYYDAKNLDIRRPNVYAANPYETTALLALRELDINPYPITSSLRDAEARANSAINQSGGLSGAQRWLSRAATLDSTLKNIAKALADVQNQHNAYRAQYANAALQAGTAAAQRKLTGIQFDEEMTARAHAARQQGMQIGIYNMLNQLQNFYANEFKRKQFNETMDLYRQQQELDRDRFDRDASLYADITKEKGAPTPRLYTPSMSYVSPFKQKSNMVASALWDPSENIRSVIGFNPYDNYSTWNLRRKGYIR